MKFEIIRNASISTSIRTRRLNINPVTIEDSAEFYKLFTNPKVMAMVYSSNHMDENSVKSIVESYANRWRNGDLLSPFTIRDHTEKYIGYVNLNHATCKQPGHVEIAIMLMDEYWQNGYAFEAIQAVIDYLSKLSAISYEVNGETLNLIIATAHPENLASINLMKKFGLKVIGCGSRGNPSVPRIFAYKTLKQNEPISFCPPDLLHDAV